MSSTRKVLRPALDVGPEALGEVVDRQSAAGGEGPVDAGHVGQDHFLGRQLEVDRGSGCPS